MKKSTKIIIGLIVGVMLLGTVIYFREKIFSAFNRKVEKDHFLAEDKNSYTEKNEKEVASKENFSLSQEEQKMEDWLKKCEDGEKIFLTEKKVEKSQEIEGKIEINYLENQASEEYFLVESSGKKRKIFLESPIAIDLLEGRKVKLLGSSEEGVFLPVSLQCISTDLEKNQLEFRRKIMNQAEQKVKEIAGRQGEFVVESFWWQNENYFYMDFFDKTDEDIFYEALVFVKEEKGEPVFERVALFKNSSEEGDLELISGHDLFEDEVNEEEGENYYEFDEILKAWSPVY